MRQLNDTPNLRSTAHSPARSWSKTRNARTILLCPLFALFAALAVGCGELEQAVEEGKTQAENIAESAGETGSSGSSSGTQIVTVTRVVDGDTVEIEPAIGGKTDLRLIGVDAPETDGSQPFSGEATSLTKKEFEGKQVRLTLGQERVDPYGRLLGNVSAPNRNRLHAELLLERGLAQDLFYEPNTENKALFESIQQDARQRGAGIWGLSQGEQCSLEDRGNGIGAGSSACP